MKEVFSKIKKLSTIKKIALVIIVLFSLSIYGLANSIYYHMIHTIGISKFSSITGISIDTTDWIFFQLPFFFKVGSILILVPIIFLFIIKKKMKLFKRELKRE